jgi:hypothetical protein
MLVEENGTKYLVRWTHNPEYKFPYAGTGCTISLVDSDVIIAVGIAKVSKKDNYNYDKGRKISLERALQELFPDNKEKRLTFWKAYFKMTHKNFLETETDIKI